MLRWLCNSQCSLFCMHHPLETMSAFTDSSVGEYVDAMRSEKERCGYKRTRAYRLRCRTSEFCVLLRSVAVFAECCGLLRNIAWKNRHTSRQQSRHARFADTLGSMRNVNRHRCFHWIRFDYNELRKCPCSYPRLVWTALYACNSLATPHTAGQI